MKTYLNKQHTLRLVLDSQFDGIIETFWVLEKRTPSLFGDYWERVCVVDWRDKDRCVRKHKLKPDWEVAGC